MAGITLGKKVKEARLKKQMTQKELAGDCITRNMLSQIENDLATPSIKTIDYLAERLKMPVSYFVDANTHKLSELDVVNQIMQLYDEEAYEACIEALENHYQNHPEDSEKRFLKNIYLNCCLLSAKKAKSQQQYEVSKAYYEKVIAHETDFLFHEDVMIYNVYSELSDIHAKLQATDKSKHFEKKATVLVSKLIANQLIQRMYIDFVEGHYEKVIEKKDDLDIKQLDPANKGRYYMMIGSAYYYSKDYNAAIINLEKAIPYYKMGTYNSLIHMIYEDLSQCYSNLDDYKKAYEYLQKSKEVGQSR